MNKIDSSFSIEPDDLELTFNYFYFLGYSIWRDSNNKLDISTDSYINRDWVNSEASHYLSNRFITDVLIDHFHLSAEKIFGVDGLEFKVDDSGNDYYFNIGHTYHDKKNLNSICAIECNILKSGYLVLTIRVKNVKKSIPSISVVNLIKKPELVRSKNNRFEVGALVRKLEEIVDKVEIPLSETLEQKKFKRNEFILNKDEQTDIPGITGEQAKYSKSSRSRPYLGILFRFSKHKYSDLEHLLPSIRRFSIAAARTTPAFNMNFVDEENYLLHKYRNVYNPGKSIVFIARRGWCVFDSEEQDPQSFTLGAVESTHLVIITILAAARSWRMYISDCDRMGKDVFHNLNRSANQLIIGSNGIKGKEYSKELEKATSFLAVARLVSPYRGISRLLEAHGMSHTARSAVRRCEDLSHILELENLSDERMSEYLDFLNIAESYHSLKSTKHSKISNSIACSAILIAIAIFINS